MLKARKEKLMQPPEGGEVSKGGGGGFLAKLRASVIFVSENLKETKSTWWGIVLQ